jgi:hypothetical protein
LAQRGTCTFYKKALMAARSGAAGIVIVNNSTDCPLGMAEPDASEVNTEDAALLRQTFVAEVDNVTATSLYSAAGLTEPHVVESFRGFKRSKVDPASAVLLAMAVLTILVAAMWSGSTFKAQLQQEQERRAALASAALVDQPGHHAAGVCCLLYAHSCSHLFS